MAFLIFETRIVTSKNELLMYIYFNGSLLRYLALQI